MHSIVTLDLNGYRNEVVSATFFRQETSTNHLGLLFPGYGYSGQMPLLYYPRQLLLESGADVFVLRYDYSERPDFQSASAEERDIWLRTDTLAAYERALAQGNYERVTLIGKSIGTRAIGHLLLRGHPLRGPLSRKILPLGKEIIVSLLR
ncbi:MAG: hypothetical protein ACLQPD_30905 [Desulfomonilaceae bacterium]